MFKKIISAFAFFLVIGLLGGIDNDNPVGLDLLLRVGGVVACFVVLFIFCILPIRHEAKEEEKKWLRHLNREDRNF